MASAWVKPAHTTLRSSTGGRAHAEPGGDPRGRVRRAVERRAGRDQDQVDVGGLSPAPASAFAAGVRGQLVHGLVRARDRRVRMPTRLLIHSSLVSTSSARSSLVSTLAGW